MKQDSVSAPKLLVCLGIMALVLGIGYRWARSPRSSPPASASTLPPPATQATDDAEPREVAPSQFIRDSQPPAVIPSTARSVSTAQPAESGNQNFYSLPLDPNLPNDQISQRVALIDQLLAIASRPAAVEALQNARALLGKRLTN